MWDDPPTASATSRSNRTPLPEQPGLAGAI